MNKLIIVTGGTKGIGKAIISRFAREGFDIVTCARNENDLRHLAEEIKTAYLHVNIYTKTADLSKRVAVDDFAGFVKSLNRKVDVLVNNAGYFLPGQIHNEPEGTFESMMAVNLNSVYYLTRHLVGSMMAARDGYIFNMCSTASIMAYTNGGSYCISKFALYGMTKVLRAELKEYGIRVTAILPGATLTASWEGVDLPAERFMKSADIAEAIYGAYSLSRQSVVEEILIRPQLGDL